MEVKDIRTRMAESFLEAVYDLIKKNSGKDNLFNSKDLKDLSELILELSNRLKEEENCG